MRPGIGTRSWVSTIVRATLSLVWFEGSGMARNNAYIKETGAVDVGVDIFRLGFGLPSDNKMTRSEQEVVIEIIRKCFGK